MADHDFDIARAGILAGVPHGFFGSAGGRHQFGYGGPGRTEEISALRMAAADTIMPGALPVAPWQVHSPDVIIVEDGWADRPDGRPQADALVTAREGLALAIVTADCAPVLFADPQTGIVGAAHAGWRGAHGGVLENTLASMSELGAEQSRIVAAIGPTIAPESYEVDAPFKAAFDEADGKHFAPAPAREGKQRWWFDLPGYIAARLRRAGLEGVEILSQDTYSQPSRYHSYRREKAGSQAGYGRQISMIARPRESG
ncbi:MAG: peptidoglycan editing factor PgeF [Erythrobacter sp.]|uniref:peptidoglycan editing factor PgeF n=1 Tax=Erythrobacter sp. TaxID=1042 RepID=UPI003C7306E6